MEKLIKRLENLPLNKGLFEDYAEECRKVAIAFTRFRAFYLFNLSPFSSTSIEDNLVFNKFLEEFYK